MRRLSVLMVAALAFVLWTADGFAQDTQDPDEFVLPPVKLKPDRPSKAVPPAPEDREAPEEKSTEAPVEEPEEAPAEPEPEKPAEAEPETTAEAEPETPTAPPEEEPGEEPAALPEPVEPEVPEPPAEAEPKPEEVQAEAVEAQIEPEPKIDLSEMGEVGLAEEVARARKAYARALRALKDYYLKRGSAYKLAWLEAESEALRKVPKYRYLTIAELAGAGLEPKRRIPAADQLFKEGLHYKDYPAFPPDKKDYLNIALKKFETVIRKYPDSDKIDDAAFRMGEIYGGWYFQDSGRAVQYYERCWQWNPDTQHPARFNAAKIYEEKLKNRGKAVELYNMVLLESRDPDKVKQARERIKALTGK